MNKEIRKNYRDDKKLRDSFNELAEEVFGLSFEAWYQNGYWKDNYNPYSIVIEGKVVANVSVNKMNMMMNGEKKHFLQLGTVMTASNYRNKGLIREIMKEIESDYQGKCDGIYLFANDEVLDFYPKFGFHIEKEYQYSKKTVNTKNRTVENIPMKDKTDWDKIKNVVDKSRAFYGFDMVDNSDLVMFYLSQFMTENVYYVKALDAYVVAEEEDNELLIYDIFAENAVKIDDVIEAFGKEITRVVLGFTPDERESYECKELHEDDTTLFVKGIGFESFGEQQLMFTPVSHA